MKRRTLLLSTGALALMSMLPRSVVALAPVHPEYDLPIRTLGVIEQALDVVVNYRFTFDERARAFGLPLWIHNSGQSVTRLRDDVTYLVTELGDTDAWNRARLLAAIRDKLTVQFPGNVEKQREALHTPLSMLGWSTLHEMMTARPTKDLYFAAYQMGVDVFDRMLHDQAALKNFD